MSRIHPRAIARQARPRAAPSAANRTMDGCPGGEVVDVATAGLGTRLARIGIAPCHQVRTLIWPRSDGRAAGGGRVTGWLGEVSPGLRGGCVYMAVEAERVDPLVAAAGEGGGLAADALVTLLFREQAVSLVRLACFFVDDRTAAEDLVQEAFIRLARSAHRIRDADRAAAYLRSIVLNLARDHNRRGLVSL